MNVHTLIFAAIVGTVAALWWAADGTRWSPARGLAWLLAGWRWRHTARQAYRVGAELVRGVALLAEAGDPTPGSQERCPRCGGRRCKPHHAGLDCGPQRAPGLSSALSGVGLHRPSAVLARWVPGNWSPYPARLRRMVWRNAWAQRLGVPPAGALA